ncbi:MAG: 4-alpha-glucanotransferase, partial [Actinobacteria bacterium]|nr:4-alpha-glucanotransferase [Actinomycetota bacterium]
MVEQGQSKLFPVHVHAGSGAHVFVRLEDGGTVEASQVDNFEPDREVDGEWLGEATFVTPSELPLGYHRLVLRSDDREVESALIVTPTWLGFPRQMGDKRIWGFATQLYSVASRDSWGVGDLTDLADLAVWSATRHFASYVLINPLHAAQPVPPMEPSPYLPSSRRYVSPLYIRPEAIPEYASLSAVEREAVDETRRELVAGLADSVRVERDDSWDAKREALELVFRAGRKQARQMAFEDFQRREGRQLRDFATWCALSEKHGRSWRAWPDPFRRPTSPEVAQFAAENGDLVTFYMWLQWIA